MSHPLYYHYVCCRSFLSSHSGKEEPTVSTFVAESEVTVVYNSRIFAESSALSPSSKPLHSLDMDLFESIEQSHLSENVRTFLTAEWPQLLRGKGDSAPAYLGMYLSSFCGCYGGGQKRHNVPKIFKDVSGLDSLTASFLYLCFKLYFV